MELNELKKSMSTLDQVLTKTNADIKINVTASGNAKNKLLNKFRKNIILYLILAVVFTSAIFGGINPLSFPIGLKLYLVALLLIATVWYAVLYKRLQKIDVATLNPAKLLTETANLKIQMISGEMFFVLAMAVFFTLLIPTAWTYNRIGCWAMIVGLVVAIINSAINYYPQYVKLFRDLNSIKD